MYWFVRGDCSERATRPSFGQPVSERAPGRERSSLSMIGDCGKEREMSNRYRMGARNFSRREFLRIAGASAVGMSAVVPKIGAAADAAAPAVVGRAPKELIVGTG